MRSMKLRLRVYANPTQPFVFSGACCKQCNMREWQIKMAIEQAIELRVERREIGHSHELNNRPPFFLGPVLRWRIYFRNQVILFLKRERPTKFMRDLFDSSYALTLCCVFLTA